MSLGQLDCAYATITVLQITLKLHGVNYARNLKYALMSQVSVSLYYMLFSQ
jgi:hypothetical protein